MGEQTIQNHARLNGKMSAKGDMVGSTEITGRIVIAGGTGFLGLNLARYLSRFKCEVTLLSRHPSLDDGNWRHVLWDGRNPAEWVGSLDGAAALVNLAGRTVDCVKTPDHCDEILRSRVEATEALGQAVRRVQSPPPVWVQMATAHRYGDPPDSICDEDSAFGFGLAPFVGRAWEKAYARAVLPQMRKLSCGPLLCSDAAAAPCLDLPDWLAGAWVEKWATGVRGSVGYTRRT